MLALVRRSQMLLAFALLLCAPGCSEPAPRPLAPAIASPRAGHVEPRPERAPPTGCRATPSTVYGDEPVVFEIEGFSGASPAAVELLDPAGQALSRATVSVPGAWRPADVPSGDFTLQVGSNRVTCSITVNRELSRATEMLR